MTAATAYCPNCGAPVQPTSGFCGNCGAKIAATTTPPFQAPSSYPAGLPSPQVSTGAYKAVIAVLLVIIILLGLGLYSTSAGHLFPFGTNRYTLTNPPNSQSIQPPSGQASKGPYTLIWNTCGAPGQGCTMPPNGWREGGVPDTYDYFVTYTSNVSITVYFFTLGQFVQYTVCNGDLSCVSGAYVYLPAATTQDMAPFRLAEGCGDYVAIYVSSAAGIMNPNITIAQNPTRFPTGYCAQVGSG